MPKRTPKGDKVLTDQAVFLKHLGNELSGIVGPFSEGELADSELQAKLLAWGRLLLAHAAILRNYSSPLVTKAWDLKVPEMTATSDDGSD